MCGRFASILEHKWTAMRHLTVVCITGMVFSGFAHAQTLSKQDLLLGAEAFVGSIESVTVHCESQIPDAGPQYAHARLTEVISVKGEKILRDHTYGTNPVHDPALHHRIVSYDGNVSVAQISNLGQAIISDGKSREAGTQGLLFFDFTMWNAAKPGGTGRCDQSLLSLLRSAGTTVRGSLEHVGNRACHVVEFRSSPAMEPDLVVWIDADRGFLPLRQVFSKGVVAKQPVLEFLVTEMYELPSGHWIPTKGTKTVLGSGVQTEFAVISDAGGTPKVQLNTIVNDELFRLQDRVPPGFTVAHLDTNQFWTVAGTDYEQGARTLDALAQNLHLGRHAIPVQRVEADLRGSRPVRWGENFAIAGVAASLVFTAGFLRSRRSR
jgi:hypothetical protein